jgi:hypothetical protein
MDDPKRTNAPTDLLPATAIDIALTFIWDAGLYKLSFVKGCSKTDDIASEKAEEEKCC